MKFDFIEDNAKKFPVTVQCQVMQVSQSAYYAYLSRPAQWISAETLNLYRRTKALFQKSRNSLGSRELMKKLRKEGSQVSRHSKSGL